MKFWLYNKEKDTAEICGSLVKVSKVTGLKIDRLKYYFSRKKVNKVILKHWDIRKVTPI